MPAEAIVPLAAADYNTAFKHIPPIQFVLDFDERLDADRLQDAIDTVLVDFWLLRGRLEVGVDGEATIRVPTHRQGAIPLDVRQPGGRLDRTSTKPGLDRLDEAARGPGGPLLRVRVDQSPGATCLGVSLSHVAGDGKSLFDFVDAWARAYSGLDYQRPSFDRRPLQAEPDGDEEPLTEAYVERKTGYLFRQADYPPAGRLVRDRLVFSAEEVADLRSAAYARDLTLNDILTARAWQAFAQYAPRREPSIHTLRCPVDYRRHLPDLGDGYFGTALRDVVMEVSAEEFAKATDEDLARIVHRGVRTSGPDAVAELLGCYERLRRAEGPEGFAKLVAPGLIVTNFTRTKVVDLDFGGVRPAYVLNLSISTRTANIVPQPDGLEIQILRRVDPIYEETRSRVALLEDPADEQ